MTHIERADTHSSRLFDWFRNDPPTIKKYLDCYPHQVDWELAWEAFDPVCFRAVFRNSDATSEELTNQTITSGIWSDILLEWPELYYKELYVKRGIAVRYDESLYVLTQEASDEFSRLLRARSTR